jgi:hypothetical protein
VRHVPPLVLLTTAEGVDRRCIVAVARRLVGAGGTGVLLADAMAMRPAVVSRVRNLCRLHPSPRRHRWSPRSWSPLGTRHRIHQFLVGCGEHADGGRESQIGQHKLLENDSVVCHGKCKVVECRLQLLVTTVTD